MKDLLKYAPVEWRKRDEFCIPRSPFSSVANKDSILLGGSRLSFLAPVHRPKHSNLKQTQIPKKYDVLEARSAGLRVDLSMPNEHWGAMCLLSRAWAFYGPWMTGCKGELFFSVAIVERFKEHSFNTASFFNPLAFEAVLVNYLNDRYGSENWGGNLSHVPRHHGPVHWKSISHFPVPCASFKIFNRGEDPNNLALPDNLIVFPISDRHFVEVCFVHEYYSRDEHGTIAIDTAPMQELQDRVVKNIELKLSPDVQSRVDKVKSEVGSLQMCKNFAPLKWPTNIYPPEAGNSPEARQALRNDA
ncbi:hypothetical protein Mag101_15230 [Microbulbifer agarilyticus]|uniref:Uncharacterized protein n=1 Tax=Microbulbifer agarilyticus TaxID=260552 RepID=A0A1Q2M7X6_9GAMM|nr:hypothetical protein [Microbulbifer agarilyticus]AQQ68833.1 hypothetical protein Mag101_15230 [Microbulbifer agarilyticus]